MNKPLLNKPLLVLIATLISFSTAEDKVIEAPKYGNVISILVGLNGSADGQSTTDKEVSKQTNKKVNK